MEGTCSTYGRDNKYGHLWNLKGEHSLRIVSIFGRLIPITHNKILILHNFM
jgi:hypothetical protein